MGKRHSLYKYWLRLYSKIVREKASPAYIARGWAIGMFYGCIGPFGAQLIMSIPTAFLLRGSKIGATLGTLITNHVTIFFIYPVQCYIGNILMGGKLSFEDSKKAMENVITQQNWQSLLEIGWELVAAFFVGGAVFAAIMTPLTYYVVKTLVVQYRARRSARQVAPPQQ